MRESRWRYAVSLVIFAVGVILGLGLIAIPVVADLEAALFDPGIQTRARLTSLRCPVVISRDETATVSARLKNTLDRNTSFFVRVHVTDGFVTLMRENTFRLELAPGEAQRVEWTINASDAVFERLVLVRATARGGYPLPQRGATCGVMVLGVPFLTGNQAYAAGLVVSLSCIVAGGWLWLSNHRDMMNAQIQITRFMGLLTAAVAVGLFLGLMRWWLPALLVLVLTLLSIGVFAGYAISDIRS